MRRPPLFDVVRCAVDTLQYSFVTRTGRLDLPPDHCTDMQGTIDVFCQIDPAVARILVTAAGQPDCTYVKTDGRWTAALHR